MSAPIPPTGTSWSWSVGSLAERPTAAAGLRLSLTRRRPVAAGS